MEHDYNGSVALFSTFGLIIWLAILVFMIVAQWKLYEKAGQPGWAILIPIYNAIVFFKIINRPVWWILLCLIPVVNIVISIIVMLDLAKAFGQSTGFAIGLILLPIVFIPILGFGNAEYMGIER